MGHAPQNRQAVCIKCVRHAISERKREKMYPETACKRNNVNRYTQKWSFLYSSCTRYPVHRCVVEWFKWEAIWKRMETSSIWVCIFFFMLLTLFCTLYAHCNFSLGNCLRMHSSFQIHLSLSLSVPSLHLFLSPICNCWWFESDYFNPILIDWNDSNNCWSSLTHICIFMHIRYIVLNCLPYQPRLVTFCIQKNELSWAFRFVSAACELHAIFCCVAFGRHFFPAAYHFWWRLWWLLLLLL